ncbi:hypothetical protein ACPPVO_43615 [Dactylosporangium sp. McL0621]|uniref:hypothetical protein n=1 Tax=Dactylosporangium sp. McL0621 TaxID=3415678 RepID=UPI003CF29299
MKMADPNMREILFTGGPRDGQPGEQPRTFVGPHHCMPDGENSTWAIADAWPGLPRYIPAHFADGVIVFEWRLPTAEEIADAVTFREAWDG